MLLEKIKNLGYIGVIGIDSIFSTSGECYPCVEINARFNMSTFIYVIKKRLNITSNVLHIWEDIIISRNMYFEQIRHFFEEQEFHLGQKNGIIYMNFIVTSSTVVQKKCRIHFLIIGDEEYIEFTKKWIGERLKQVDIS